jgi:antitoxin HicB
MKTHTYRILLTEEPEGGFTVTVPALPGCVTYGSDLNEAMDMAKEAIEGYIALLKEEGEPIPDDNNTLEYALTIESKAE